MIFLFFKNTYPEPVLELYRPEARKKNVATFEEKTEEKNIKVELWSG